MRREVTITQVYEPNTTEYQWVVNYRDSSFIPKQREFKTFEEVSRFIENVIL